MNCDLIYFTEMFGQRNQKKDFQRPDVVPGQYGQSNEQNLNIHFSYIFYFLKLRTLR